MALKIKLDFNKPALALDGKAYKEMIAGENGQQVVSDNDLTLNKIIANNLVNGSEPGDLYKLTDWGKSLYAGEVLELDKPDTDKLKKIIEESKSTMRLIKRQMCDIIDEAIEAAKAAEKAPLQKVD